MAMRVPGHAGRSFFTAMMTAMVSTPSPRVVRWAACRCEAMSSSEPRNELPGAGFRPRKLGICLNPIRTAAPALKPRITECDTKLRNTPRRARPMPI